uniref:CCHC-type domain-containing protein n=1 Tax=Scleropages formosus TaxID=113540 RepID=A0A8C9TDW6_SCLFO
RGNFFNLRFFQENSTNARITPNSSVYGVVRVILGLLGLTVEDVICIQRNNPLRFFDVTLTTEAGFKRMIESCRTLVDHPVLKFYDVENRWVNNQRTVTVHVFNPFITAESIREFLQKYVEVLPGHKDMRDELGFWNGKRQFRIRLLPDPQGFDGFCHPPAVFNLGTSKGYLFYSNQPPFCRVCQGFGHTGADCTNMRCNNCLEKGHMARDCNGPRRCNVCGAEDHLARTCHLRKPTYADAVSGSRVSGGREGEMLAQPDVVEDRLDYILASDSVVFKRVHLSPHWPTDHLMVESTVSIEAPLRGPGYWKLNVDVLKEKEYRDLFYKHFKVWQELKSFCGSVSDWWEDTKTKVRTITRQYCVRRRARSCRAIRKVEKKLEKLYAHHNNGKDFNSDREVELKAKLR